MEQLQADLVKVWKGAVLAGLGAFGAFALQGLAGVDFGENQVWVGAVISVAANAVRKLLWPWLIAKFDQWGSSF